MWGLRTPIFVAKGEDVGVVTVLGVAAVRTAQEPADNHAGRLSRDQGEIEPSSGESRLGAPCGLDERDLDGRRHGDRPVSLVPLEAGEASSGVWIDSDNGAASNAW